MARGKTVMIAGHGAFGVENVGSPVVYLVYLASQDGWMGNLTNFAFQFERHFSGWDISAVASERAMTIMVDLTVTQVDTHVHLEPRSHLY